MGEPEDEFAKAEALLQRLEQEPVTGPGIIEQAVEAQSTAAKTFRVNSYYEAPVELFANQALYTNKNVTKFPAQTNGDVYPYIVGQGRVRGSEFAVDGKIYYKIIGKSKHQSEYMIQIATAGVMGRNLIPKSCIDYLNAAGAITEPGILYIVRCNAEVFKRTIPVNSVKEWPSSGFRKEGFLNFTHADVTRINTAYADACVAHTGREQAKKKAKADALWAQKNERAFIKSQKLEIKKIAEEIFPGNAYFIDYEVGLHMDNVFVRDYDDLSRKNISTCLLIRFPSFDIVNKKGQTHNMKDLWVLIPFNIKKIKAPNTDILVKTLCIQSSLWGCRSTQTSAEHLSGYKHSHLTSNSSSDKKFTSFCLGGASSISISVAELTNYFSVERFELFLYELSAYVKYESIEGGPYIRMENIGKGRQSYTTRSMDYALEYRTFMLEAIGNNYTRRSKSCLIKIGKKFILPIEYNSLKKQYVLNENNEAFLQFLGKTTTQPQVKDANGGLVGLNETKKQYTPEEKARFKHKMFRLPDGDEYFSIVDLTDNVEEGEEVIRYPLPDLVKYIKNTVEQELDVFYTLKESYEFS